MHLTAFENPYIEGFFGTLRRELLDHVIVLTERHLNRLLSEYIEQYYHCARPHQGLDGDTPIPIQKPAVVDRPVKLLSFPICGGLHQEVNLAACVLFSSDNETVTIPNAKVWGNPIRNASRNTRQV